MSLCSKVFVAVAIVFCLFFFREIFVFWGQKFQIFGEKNVVFVVPKRGNLFAFGKERVSGKMILRRIRPYFSRAEIISLQEEEEGVTLEGKDFVLQKFSSNIMRLKKGTTIFWILGAITEEEITQLKLQRISFESDFWILLKGNGFMNTGMKVVPAQGIFYVGERSPGKKLQNFARENKIPLISMKDTGGFRLTEKHGKWIVRTRE